jgi:hypothetical protein
LVFCFATNWAMKILIDTDPPITGVAYGRC